MHDPMVWSREERCHGGENLRNCRSTLAALAVICISASLPGQVPDQRAVDARDHLRASVLVHVKHDGRRVAGARVTLLSRPFPEDERAGDADRIEIDAPDGEARARVLRGRAYSVWATLPSESGATFLTDIAECVYAGMAVTLTRERDARPPLSLRMLGLDAWVAAPPTRVRVRAQVANVEVREIELAGADPVAVPVLPGDRFTVEVLGRDGALLRRSRPRHWADLAGQDVLDVVLDPPRPVTVFVCDAAGVGIAGASILRSDGERMYPLATTAADGSAALAVPTPRFIRQGTSIARGSLLAQAEGHALHVLDPWTAASAKPAGGYARWGAKLQRADPVVGRWLWRGRPLSGIAIVALYVIVGGNDAATAMGSGPAEVAYRHVTTTDAEGWYRLPATAGFEAPIVAAVLGEAQLRLLPEAWTRLGLCPIVFATPRADAELGRLELLEIRVQNPDGLPAELARLDVVPERRVADAFGRITMHADRQGCLTLLRDREAFAIYARSDAASALVDVVGVTANQRAEVPAAEIRLRPYKLLRGEVVTPAGEPAPHAPLMVHVAPEAAGAAGRPDDAPIREASAQEIRDPVRIRRLLAAVGKGSAWSVKVDENGAFECLVDDLDVEFEFQRSTAIMRGVPLVRVRPRERATRALRVQLGN